MRKYDDLVIAVEAAVNAELFADETSGSFFPVILDKRKVELAAPIKSLGTHQVVVRVQGDISAKVAVEVVAAS